MKLHTDSDARMHRITAYGPGFISINDHKVTRSVIVMPETLILDWAPQDYSGLTMRDIEAVAELKPEVALLGTGVTQLFPSTGILSPFAKQGIGVEVMHTPAACRTYNILMTEGRTVAAALMMMAQ